MCKTWIDIADCKEGEEVIFLFADGHVENGELSEYKGKVVHWLRSGEVYVIEPVAFIPMPSK